MEELYVTTRAEWRAWLAKNHARSSGVWLVFYKKHTKVASVEYDAVVEEALCFGWIDSLVKRIDNDRFARKLTPRKPGSGWSELNKKRVAAMRRKGLMRQAGLAKVEAAKKSGSWNQSRPAPRFDVLPVELKQAWANNKKAQTHFARLAPSYQKQFIAWIASAKRPETRKRRAAEAIDLLSQGKKLGMK